MTRQSVSLSTMFSFSRACTASYVDAAGVTQTAAVDEPRFDHDPSGSHAALGLLVQGVPEIAAADRLSINPALADAAFLPAVAPGRYTVLHQRRDPGGTVRRCARYTTDPRGLLNDLLRLKGWQQLPLIFAYDPVPWPDSDDPADDELTLSEDGLSVLDLGQNWTFPVTTSRVTATGAVRVTSTGATRTLDMTA